MNDFPLDKSEFGVIFDIIKNHGINNSTYLFQFGKDVPNRFHDIAETLAEQAGVPVPEILILPGDNFYDSGNVSIGPTGSSQQRHTIFFSSRFLLADGSWLDTRNLTNAQVAGAIAHEIAHAQLGHVDEKARSKPERREREFAADLAGAALLCGTPYDPLSTASFLNDVAWAHQVTIDDDTHPDTPARIERLRQFECPPDEPTSDSLE